MRSHIYIYDAIRTPRGRARQDGGLHDLSPLELMKVLFDALEARSDLDRSRVEDVILGCVTQAGEQAANIGKTSLLFAGWPSSIPGITISRYCSSGLDAINFAALKVGAGQASVALAGGVEMMSRVPMLSDRPTVFTDVELATRCRMLMMGSGADLVASIYGVSRTQADEVALESQRRAARARAEGWFRSIVAVWNPKKGITVEQDECIRPDATLAELAKLEPSFAGLGATGADALQLAAHPDVGEICHIHTAGNSPAMADGAALTLIGDESLRNEGLQPRARFVDAVSICGNPLEVISGCAVATQQLMKKCGLSSMAVDLFELHEAFAATTIKCQRDLGVDADKLNVNGGVIALGHPMGATGAMLVGTLVDELERRDLQTGIVAASGAGGTGTALLIERV